jgi:hypothetical protein
LNTIKFSTRALSLYNSKYFVIGNLISIFDWEFKKKKKWLKKIAKDVFKNEQKTTIIYSLAKKFKKVLFLHKPVVLLKKLYFNNFYYFSRKKLNFNDFHFAVKIIFLAKKFIHLFTNLNHIYICLTHINKNFRCLTIFIYLFIIY